jgi:hypothetical protein
MVVTIRLAQRELVGAFWVLTITPVVSGLSATNYTFSPSNGTLTINKATISGTAANPSVTYDGSPKSATVITGVLPSGATFIGSVTASGTSAGTYSSSITGSLNYQGTVNGGTFTINQAQYYSFAFILTIVMN